MKRALLVAFVVALAGPAAAHPHVYVVQQAALSLGRTQAVLTYRIAPSTTNGDHIFDHLDTDGDGALSDVEQGAFAAALLAKTTLAVDGARVSPSLIETAFPNRKTMAAGGGVIEMTARAPLTLGAGAAHKVTLAVSYDLFAKDWFLQPFYFADLAAPAPRLERPRGSTAINILLAANS